MTQPASNIHGLRMGIPPRHNPDPVTDLPTPGVSPSPSHPPSPHMLQRRARGDFSPPPSGSPSFRLGDDRELWEEEEHRESEGDASPPPPRPLFRAVEQLPRVQPQVQGPPRGQLLSNADRAELITLAGLGVQLSNAQRTRLVGLAKRFEEARRQQEPPQQLQPRELAPSPAEFDAAQRRQAAMLRQRAVQAATRLGLPSAEPQRQVAAPIQQSQRRPLEAKMPEMGKQPPSPPSPPLTCTEIVKKVLIFCTKGIVVLVLKLFGILLLQAASVMLLLVLLILSVGNLVVLPFVLILQNCFGIGCRPFVEFTQSCRDAVDVAVYLRTDKTNELWNAEF